MHRSVRAALTATLLAVAALPAHMAPAYATDVTPEQATALEGQVRSWVQDLLGPDAHLGERPIQVTPEGEHYHLAVPIRVTRGFTTDAIMVTGLARPASDGRWTIEDVRFPSPSSFTLQLPLPPKPGEQTPEPPIPVDYTVTAGAQDNQGVYDPSFATPSTFTTSVQDLKVAATSALTERLTTVRRIAGLSTLRPSSAGRMDLITDSTMEGYAVSSKIGDNQRVEIAVDKVRGSGEVTAVSREQAAKLIPVLARLIGSVPGAPKPGGPAPTGGSAIDSQALRALVQSLQDVASELTLDENADSIALHYGPYSGAASRFHIGAGARSDDGLLRAHMDLGLDGLALPDVVQGDMAGLLPRKIALRPVVSGVPTEQLLQLLAASGNRNGADPSPGAAILFSRGTVSAGLESFAFDMGGADFAGTLALTIPSPQQMTGQAQVTATNFDALMQRANSIPELAGVLPGLVFAKGIGRAVDNRVVWDITYRDNKLLVNGTDLSAMTGGGRR